MKWTQMMKQHDKAFYKKKASGESRYLQGVEGSHQECVVTPPTKASKFP